MRYLDAQEVLEIHRLIMQSACNASGLLNVAALESAVAQPGMTFGGTELFPTVVEKAAALAFSLIQNHPFVDGNKRTGHAALETFLVLNGHELDATTDEQFQIVLGLAASEISRDAFVEWVREHVVPLAKRSAAGGPSLD